MQKTTISVSKKIEQAQLIQYDKSLHEIYNDIEKEIAQADLIKFLGDLS